MQQGVSIYPILSSYIVIPLILKETLVVSNLYWGTYHKFDARWCASFLRRCSRVNSVVYLMSVSDLRPSPQQKSVAGTDGGGGSG